MPSNKVSLVGKVRKMLVLGRKSHAQSALDKFDALRAEGKKPRIITVTSGWVICSGNTYNDDYEVYRFA